MKNTEKGLTSAVWKNDSSNIYELLEKASQNDKDYALHLACMKSNNTMVELLLDNGSTIDPKRRYHPLVEVVKNNNIEGAKLLLSKGVDVHFNNDKALAIAAKTGNKEMVEFLLQNGADLHAKEDYALRCASERNHVEVMKVLIAHGAKIEANEGSALTRACVSGSYQAASLLLENGADPKGCNSDNKPIYHADANNHLSIVSLLKEHGADLKAVKHAPITQNNIKKFISVLKEVKNILPQGNEMQGKITETIMKQELTLPLLPVGPRKPDAQFDKFLNIVAPPSPQPKRKPGM